MPSPGSSEPAGGAPPSAPGKLVTPGLVDQHCHGHGGVDFATAPADEVRSALGDLSRRGVTRVVASVPTMPGTDLVDAVHRLTPLVRTGELAGIHLEGPFLSPHRCGAQSPADVLRPDDAGTEELVRALLAAGASGQDRSGLDGSGLDGSGPGDNAITAMTYAPELEGAAWLEATLLAAGVSPSPGHTDATAGRFAAAVDRICGGQDARDSRHGDALRADGDSDRTPAVTHLFNAMAGFHHRRPGPVPTALAAAAAGRLRLELIADGHHVDPEVVRDVIRLAPSAVCVVSDASAATAAAPGRYRLGTVGIETTHRTAAPTLVEDPGVLASGAVTLETALAHLIDWGIPWETAVRTVTTNPARGLPRHRRAAGWVVWDAPGRPADVVLPGR